MKKHTLALSFALSVATFGATSAALAQDASIGAGLGATALSDEGETVWRPTLRLDATLGLVGPLEGGAYLQVVGSELPLANPGLGAGLFVAVRPSIPFLGAVRPIGEASIGRHALPSESQGTSDAWAAALGVGLGIEVNPVVQLEGRVHHAWLLGLEEGSGLDESAWTVTAGLRIGL